MVHGGGGGGVWLSPAIFFFDRGLAPIVLIAKKPIIVWLVLAHRVEKEVRTPNAD